MPIFSIIPPPKNAMCCAAHNFALVANKGDQVKARLHRSKPMAHFASDEVMPPDWPRRLSIAMLAACPFPTHQGTQVFIRHLASALTGAGHDVHLISYGHGEYEETMPFHLHRARPLSTRLRSGPH